MLISRRDTNRRSSTGETDAAEIRDIGVHFNDWLGHVVARPRRFFTVIWGEKIGQELGT